MLRMIVGTRRRTELVAGGEQVLENSVAWVRRATAEAEKIKIKHEVPDWADEVAPRSFCWTGQVMRMIDGCWAKTVQEWSLVG